MRKPDAPCKGCEKRRHRCHAMCIEYAAFCHDNEAYKKTVRDNREADNAVEHVGVVRSMRIKKSSGKVKK